MSEQSRLMSSLAEQQRAAERVAARLRRSRQALAGVLPVTAADVGTLPAPAEDAIDAFLKRFEQLQDLIQNGLFRTLALLEGESVAALSRRDIALLMEKLGVIDAADTWSELALLRNMLAHEYPGRPDKQAQRLNLAYAAATPLLAGLDRLKDYVARKQLLPPTG